MDAQHEFNLDYLKSNLPEISTIRVMLLNHAKILLVPRFHFDKVLQNWARVYTNDTNITDKRLSFHILFLVTIVH